MKRDAVCRDMNRQMLNWAAYACGRIGTEVTTAGHCFESQLTSIEPIIDEAIACENALLEMKRARAQQYKALMLRYRNGWMYESCAEEMRMSVPTFKNLQRTAYYWLDGKLNGRARH